MSGEDYAIRFASMEWESPAPKVRAKVRQLGSRRLRLVEFQRGMEHPEWCHAGHVGYVLEGRLALEFDGGTVEIGPGDGLIIPAGEADRHRPVPLSERVLLVLSEAINE